MARVAFYISFALTLCSFAGIFMTGFTVDRTWSEYLIVPFLVFPALAAISLRIADRRGELDASDWRGDI